MYSINPVEESLFFYPSLLSYINKIRLNHAYNDLMNTSLTINEIALNHGFKNVKAFNKIFKEYYHDIPSKYRKG